MSGCYFIADDLSGALDAAAAFHRSGHRVVIPLSAGDWTAAGPEVITGLTTETRNTPADKAAEAVSTVIARGRDLGANLVYKKIDSTLRGPVAAELGAVLAALPGTRLLFAPANPAVGRTVSGGVLLVRDRPVHETEFGRDPVSPVRESRLKALLADLPAGKMEIPDTADFNDLERAVEAQRRRGGEWVAVGSGALARPVAAMLTPGSASTGALHRRPPPPGPVLLLGGSAHPINRHQASRLRETEDVPTHVLLPDSPVNGVVEEIVGSLRTRGAAILLAAAERTDSAAVLERLTAVATAAIEATDTARVFATGGETARALCVALDVRQLAFEAELEPGLAVASGTGRSGPLLLAVKPGGFGDDATWRRAWEFLATA